MGPMRLTRVLVGGALVALWCAAASSRDDGGLAASGEHRVKLAQDSQAEQAKQLVGLAVELGREYNRHKAGQGTGIQAETSRSTPGVGASVGPVMGSVVPFGWSL